MDSSDLERFNPWWKTGRVKEEWLKPFKRVLYSELAPYVSKRQVLVVQGLRRTGKSTLLFQLIQDLLNGAEFGAKPDAVEAKRGAVEAKPVAEKRGVEEAKRGVEAKRILYFSFDEQAFDLKVVLEAYQKLVLGKTFDEIDGSKEKVFLFLDEVQKVGDWENKLKVYYDLYPNVKFVVSGSASVNLRKRSRESLAGRAFDFVLTPLSFEEFLELSGKDVGKIKANPDLWKRELQPLFYKYLKYGGFPELVLEEDEDAARKYLVNDVIERVIYKDLPEEFKVKDLELLKQLVYFIGRNPGALVNYAELAKNFGRDQRTIANYFEYLEFGLLVRFVFNYRGSPLASLRKLKKIYFASPNLVFALNPDFERVLPAVLENAVLLELDAEFFFKNSFEVDFVLVDGASYGGARRGGSGKGGGASGGSGGGDLTAVEVKTGRGKSGGGASGGGSRGGGGGFDTGQLRKFKEKFGARVKKSVLIVLDDEGKEGKQRKQGKGGKQGNERASGVLVVKPAWKLLLFGL